MSTTLIPSNPNAPHRAVIWVRAEVHERLPSGECSGRPVHKVAEFPLAVDGSDHDLCVRALNETLAELKKRCRI